MLYEVITYPAAHTFLGLVYLLEGNQQEAVREIQLEDDPGWKAYRITSYNVCYTKLLRRPSSGA